MDFRPWDTVDFKSKHPVGHQIVENVSNQGIVVQQASWPIESDAYDLVLVKRGRCAKGDLIYLSYSDEDWDCGVVVGMENDAYQIVRYGGAQPVSHPWVKNGVVCAVRVLD